MTRDLTICVSQNEELPRPGEIVTMKSMTGEVEKARVVNITDLRWNQYGQLIVDFVAKELK